jgi:uncharacterized protein (TIGR00730 family)
MSSLHDERRILSAEDEEVERDIAAIAEEFRMGFETVAGLPKPAVTLFGSARVAESHPAYQAARETGRLFAESGWTVVTGGGPGAMEAGNRGAKEGGGFSVGFNIVLPHEQESNSYLDVGLTFRHFYARKVCFAKAAEGFVVFPGGFGTMDELFEALTLIQTGKLFHFPVALFDSDYWEELLVWVRDEALRGGMISPADLQLVTVTDDPAEAVETVIACYERRCAHELVEEAARGATRADAQ